MEQRGHPGYLGGRMTEHVVATLTASQQIALQAVYGHLARCVQQVRQARIQVQRVCGEIGIDPNGSYRLDGDQLVSAETEPEMADARGLGA